MLKDDAVLFTVPEPTHEIDSSLPPAHVAVMLPNSCTHTHTHTHMHTRLRNLWQMCPECYIHTGSAQRCWGAVPVASCLLLTQVPRSVCTVSVLQRINTPQPIACIAATILCPVLMRLGC